MRRTLAALAAPLLLLTLVACGTDDAPEEATDAPVTEASQEPADGGRDAPTEEETSQNEEVEEAPDEPAGTAVETLWIDDSWSVEEVEDDLCEMGMSETIYSEQEDMFTCGPNAAGALACALEDGQEVLCIVDPLEKKAIRFASPSAAAPHAEVSPSGMEPVPLFVELPDGAICSTITHDHDQHWNDLFSWFRCDDGSELLTPEYIDSTFTRGDTWTAQHSVDKGEPEKLPVAEVTFAGR